MTVKELQLRFKTRCALERSRIRKEPNRFKRLLKYIWYWFLFPWKWAFVNIRDWRTLVIFLIVLAVYSGSVWGWYLGALLCGWTSTEAGVWLIGIGSAVWAWWLSPLGSPFILLCVCSTIGIKALFNKIGDRKKCNSRNTE